MMDRRICFYVSALLFCSGMADGFTFFNRKADCLVSQWSEWSDPFGFGTVSRVRRVLRYPQNGGAPCPTNLEEVKNTSQPVSLRTTSQTLASCFVAPNSYSITTGSLRDLLLIFDASGSIGSSNFDIAKKEVARLLGYVCPDPDPFKGYQQAALLKYSSLVSEIFDFNDKSNTAGVQAGINSMSFENKMTCTATAFDYARTSMFTAAKGARFQTDVKHEVLIISDGRSNCGGDAILAAKALKDSGVEVFGLFIGVTGQSAFDELTSYVSAPLNQHLFAIDGYQELTALVDLVQHQMKNVPCVHFE